MASTLPDLTWQRTNLFSPATNNTMTDVITAINQCITATDWVIHQSGSDYILFGPPNGSAIANMRLLIGGSAFTSPNAAQMDGTHTTATNRMYISIAPDSGKTSLTNPWTSSSNPFDTDRFSGFAKWHNLGGDNCDSLYAVYSDEVFALVAHEASSDDMHMFVAGAMIAPPDDAAGEGTPGRIYAYAATGDAILSNTFHKDISQFFGDNTQQNNQTRAFRPDSPTSQTDVDKVSMTTVAQPRMTSFDGSIYFLPIVMYRETGSFNMLGIARQIGFWSDARDRQIIQDSGANDKAYIVGSQRNIATDCMVFYNKS